MVSGFISRIVILIFGTLYPAYASYKAVRTKNVKEYVKWMMYWIVFALFTCAETFTDLFLSFWFPFYYEIKIITVIYLLSPATKGSSILYRKFVHPVLIKREQDIDEYIAKAKEQGYHTMLNLGSKGVTYATSLIMQTAIKGSNGLVSQLRKSYSLNDLSQDQHMRTKEAHDVTDNTYGEDPRLIRRNTVQSPSQAAHPQGLYFPDVGVTQRPGEEVYYREIPSSEEISSGYSSGDPLYYGTQEPKGDYLVRTGSLGRSSRIRTRAAVKYGLPKRSSVSEGGSTWSAMELHESQTETDRFLNFPLSHSVSLPFSFLPVQHVFLPEYQRMFGNMTQNQMFTFINHCQYPSFFVNQNTMSENNDGTLEGKTEDSNNLPVVVPVDSSEGGENQTEVPTTSKSFTNGKEKREVLIEETEKSTGKSNVVENSIKKKDNLGKVAQPSESLETKERSGKYNKKPAPTPPIEETKITKISVSAAEKAEKEEEEEEEIEFHTPSASPKPERKHNSNINLSTGHENEDKPHSTSNFLEVPEKLKSKSKKKDFKLHIPKMSFSFWHQKNGKQSSASETSSTASGDIVTTRLENTNETEYFIPLKDRNESE